MTIEEIKALKFKTEMEVESALKKLEETSGLTVTDMEISQIITISYPRRLHVKIKMEVM